MSDVSARESADCPPTFGCRHSVCLPSVLGSVHPYHGRPGPKQPGHEHGRMTSPEKLPAWVGYTGNVQVGPPRGGYPDGTQTPYASVRLARGGR
jgi:hypothetical protein